MQQLNYKQDESLGELIGDLARETRTLVQQEIALAKVELKQSLKHVAKAGTMLGGAAVVGHVALLAFTTALIALLATFMPVWVSALLVSIALGIVAFVLMGRGRTMLAENELAPKQTIQTVREDVLWLTKRN